MIEGLIRVFDFSHCVKAEEVSPITFLDDGSAFVDVKGTLPEGDQSAARIDSDYLPVPFELIDPEEVRAYQIGTLKLIRKGDRVEIRNRSYCNERGRRVAETFHLVHKG